MKLLIIFIALNVINVVLQTIKSICTIKCGKIGAAVVNAVAYGLYTVVLVYMSCDLSTMAKALIVGGCNLVGVYIVKTIEEKVNKDKLWKIEITCTNEQLDEMTDEITYARLSYNTQYINDEYSAVNIYSKTQAESLKAKEIINKFNVKYFVAESKIL